MRSSGYNSKPSFILGMGARSFSKVLILFFSPLAAFIILIKLSALYPEPHVHQSATNYFFTGGIYFTPDIAGFIGALFLIADFTRLISGLIALLAGVMFFRTGQVNLYDDQAVWRKGKHRDMV